METECERLWRGGSGLMPLFYNSSFPFLAEAFFLNSFGMSSCQNLKIKFKLLIQCLFGNGSLLVSPLHFKTKYIKLNTKTQNIFCCLNENLTTFLYTLTGATREQKERKKVFSLKYIQKSNVIKKKNLGFIIWIYVFGFS